MKPHGALYNVAARDHSWWPQPLHAPVAAFSREVALVGLAGSALIAAGQRGRADRCWPKPSPTEPMKPMADCATDGIPMR
ncbi:LamB/YcsF family protein [Chloroflexus sp.]|uniref:LamB/YcsF family protein n=1 Tax=Chloroflexus sp. TaxID=1904827 RepID=UPI0035B50AE2